MTTQRWKKNVNKTERVETKIGKLSHRGKTHPCQEYFYPCTHVINITSALLRWPEPSPDQSRRTDIVTAYLPGKYTSVHSQVWADMLTTREVASMEGRPWREMTPWTSSQPSQEQEREGKYHPSFFLFHRYRSESCPAVSFFCIVAFFSLSMWKLLVYVDYEIFIRVIKRAGMLELDQHCQNQTEILPFETFATDVLDNHFPPLAVGYAALV